MYLGERLKEQRKKHGMSQEKLAELVGVSRQAITKWEANQSMPSTEHLFKLANIFQTTVDMILGEEIPPAEQPQPCCLYQLERAKKSAQLRAKRKKNIFFALLILFSYLLVYILGRIPGANSEQSSVMGWLFGENQSQSYLYGWLLKQNLFWGAMVISIIPTLFGKFRFSFTTLFAFILGILLGEFLGENPVGAPYGQGHYGWAIWGVIFILSTVMGIILERLSRGILTLNSKKFWLWCAACIIVVIAVVLFALFSIPRN